jgi:hypothetical protein
VLFFAVLGQVDAECCAGGVGRGAGVRFHEQHGHLLVDAVVFGEGQVGGVGGRRVHGGWVHVVEVVLVEARVGPEFLRVRACGFFHLDDAAVGPEEEGAVEDGCGRGDDGAGYRGRAPFVAVRREEVVCDGEEAEGGRGECGPIGLNVSRGYGVAIGEAYRKTLSAWKRSLRQAKHSSAVNEYPAVRSATTNTASTA